MNDIMLWSPPDGCEISFAEMKEKYGLQVAIIANTYKQDKEQYPKKFIGMMYAIHDGRFPKVETEEDKEAYKAGREPKTKDPKRIAAGKKAAKTKAKKQEPTGIAAQHLAEQRVDLGIPKEEPEIEMCDPNQFLKVPYGDLQTTGWRSMCNETSVMLELMKRAVASDAQRDGYGIQKEFYKRGYLACVAKHEELAQWFGVNEKTIRRIITKLEDRNFIWKDKSPRYKNVNVYVVGRWEQFNPPKKGEVKRNYFFKGESVR